MVLKGSAGASSAGTGLTKVTGTDPNPKKHPYYNQICIALMKQITDTDEIIRDMIQMLFIDLWFNNAATMLLADEQKK